MNILCLILTLFSPTGEFIQEWVVPLKSMTCERAMEKAKHGLSSVKWGHIQISCEVRHVQERTPEDNAQKTTPPLEEPRNSEED